MKNKIAILYDFDLTLGRGYMQSFGLMQDLGYNDVIEFFKANDSLSNDKDMDMCLSMLCGTLELVREQGKLPTKDYFRSFGKNIEYYDGVIEWFDKINAIGDSLGFDVDHYIISSGIKEVLEGCSIAPYMKRIYANSYAYKNGLAFWPCQVVNYTSKTQYIYRVRKQALDDLRSLEKVNEKMDEDDMIPFSNIIYIGDSETDIPSFKVVKNSGGMSICVYEEKSAKAKRVAQKCFIEGRCNHFTPANYTENSELFNIVSGYITNLKEE